MEDYFCKMCSAVAYVPITLECGHLVCGECIDMVRNWDALRPAPTHQMRCPLATCQKETRLAQHLKIDNTLQDTIADYAKQACIVPLCAECEVSAVTTFCIHCACYFCDACSASVHGRKVLASHRLLSASDVPPTPKRVCGKHDKPMDHYCSDCDAIACDTCCRYGTHREHKSFPASKADDMLRIQVDEQLKQMEVQLLSVKDKAEAAKACSMEIQGRRSTLLEEIRSSFTALRARLDIRELALMNDVRQHLDAVDSSAIVKERCLLSLRDKLAALVSATRAALLGADPIQMISRVSALRKISQHIDLDAAADVHIDQAPAVFFSSGGIDAIEAQLVSWIVGREGPIDLPAKTIATSTGAGKETAAASPGVNAGLPPCPPPTVTGTNGDYKLSWKPVNFALDSPLRTLELQYELLLDGTKIVYSGLDTSIGVQVPAGAPTYSMALRYVAGIHACPWSAPVKLSPRVSALQPVQPVKGPSGPVRFLVWGAGGAGGGVDESGNDGGAGGFVTALYEAEVGEVLTVVVGAGGCVNVQASGGAPNGGNTYESTNGSMTISGGGGGSSHIISHKHDGTVILGAGGGGGAAASHMYAGTPGVGGGGGGGTHEGKVGLGGKGAGTSLGQAAQDGLSGGGGGGGSPMFAPGNSDAGGSGGKPGRPGVSANGAGGCASRKDDTVDVEGRGRKSGGGGGGAASAKYCLEGSFRAVDAVDKRPIIIPGEESEGAGRGGSTGGLSGGDGRVVILFPDGARAVFTTPGEHKIVIPKRF